MFTTLLTVVFAILFFGVMIFVHELGHFLTAKKAGIQVNEFSIGMGPAIFKTVKNGTQYSIRLLPIGGYVMMEGEDEELEDSSEQSHAQKGEFVTAPEGATGVPYPEAAIWKRMIVIAAGGIMNLLLGLLVSTLLVAFGPAENMGQTRVVSQVLEGSSAQQAGLLPMDEIIQVDGQPVADIQQLVQAMAASEDKTVDLTVQRDNQVETLRDIAFQQSEDGVLHVGFELQLNPKTPLAVVRRGWDATVFYGGVVLDSIVSLVSGQTSPSELSGPVGIVSVISQTAQQSMEQLGWLFVMLTVNLGLFNLLPLPALDGGKLVLLVLEGIFRRPIPKKVEIAINLAGIMAFLALMCYATFHDLLRLF